MTHTEQFIKMCKAREIQDAWKPDHGDYLMVEAIPSPMIVLYHDNGFIMCTNNDTSYRDDCVWLPSQEQLQAMLDIPFSEVSAGCEGLCLTFTQVSEHFMWFCHDKNPRVLDTFDKANIYPQQFNTMNELWLAFVMENQFYKRWDKTSELWETHK